MLDRETVFGVKVAVAVFVTAWLVLDLALRWLGRAETGRRLRDATLAAAGLVALLCWWNLLRFGFDDRAPTLSWVHFSDAFHYYMGPKYFRELGYTHLYDCSAAAEQQLGDGPRVARRTYRDLETNEVVSGGAILARSRACQASFSPERWQLFVHDVAWFRSRMPGWETTMQDWGYNATPAWNVLGSWVAGNGPVSERRIAWLSVLDVPVVLSMWALVVWAFGWRTACVALAFWGTNLAGGYNWTGGSILRQEWLLASAAGVCLLRKEKWVAAGAAITYAASLAIFPAALALGTAVRLVLDSWRQRRLRLAPESLRLLLGAALAVAVVVPLSAQRAGGIGAWLRFADNIRGDMQPAPNNVGLPMLLSYDGDTRLRMLTLENRARPAADWGELRKETLAGRRLWLLLAVAAYAALFVGAARSQPEWVTAILGLGFPVLALQLSCYYWAVLLLYGFLWPRFAGVGVALSALSVASHAIYGRWPDPEEYSTWFSGLGVLFVYYAAAVACFAGRWAHFLHVPRTKLQSSQIARAM